MATEAFPWHCLLCKSRSDKKADLARVVANNLEVEVQPKSPDITDMFDQYAADDSDIQRYLDNRKLAGLALIREA